MTQQSSGEGPDYSWRTWIPPVTTLDLCEDDVHLLLWQVRGSSDLVIDGVEHLLTSGHAMWVPVGTRHGFTVHANAVMMPLFFASSTTATTLIEPHYVTVDRELRTLMLAYMATLYTVVQQRPNLARQILARIEKKPALATTLPMPTKEPAAIVAETLRFNPGDTRSVQELADLAHTSVRTLGRSFLAETGMTLRQWRIRNRLDSAAVLLRAGSTIEAVAQRVGYTNVKSFRYVFTEYYGLSPTEYVKRYAAQ